MKQFLSLCSSMVFLGCGAIAPRTVSDEDRAALKSFDLTFQVDEEAEETLSTYLENGEPCVFSSSRFSLEMEQDGYGRGLSFETTAVSSDDLGDAPVERTTTEGWSLSVEDRSGNSYNKYSSTPGGTCTIKLTRKNSRNIEGELNCSEAPQVSGETFALTASFRCTFVIE